MTGTSNFRHAQYDAQGVGIDDPQVNLPSVRLDPTAPALVDSSGNTVFDLENTGTPAIPVYELRASVLPRTGTLAALSALTSGGGELCAPSDANAIVQLAGPVGAGWTHVYTPMYVGTWDPDNYTLKAPADTAGLTLTCAPATGSESPGSVFMLGGDSEASVAGDAWIKGGTGTFAAVAGGSVSISGGEPGNGGQHGNITLRCGTSPFGGSQGNITLQPASTGAITLTNSSGTAILKAVGDGKLSFFNAAGTTKPTVSGSRGGNAALASLLTALSGLGLLTDSSSA